MRSLRFYLFLATALLPACTPGVYAASPTLLGNTSLAADAILTIPSTASLRFTSSAGDVFIQNSDGAIQLGDVTVYANEPWSLGSNNLSEARYYDLPNASGTLALFSDLQASNLGGTLGTTQGGTGRTTLTAGNLLSGNATGPLTLIAPGTSGNVLTSNGTAWRSATPTGGGGNITINTTAPLTINGNSTATTSNATLAISAATPTTAGSVPGLGGLALTNATDFFSLAHRFHVIPVSAQTWTNAGTNTGSVGGEPGAMRYGGAAGVTGNSTLRLYLNNVGNTFQGALHDVNSNSTLNFSARWAFTFQFFTDSQHANATTYFMLGIAASTAYGVPTTKSVGLRVVNGTGVGFTHDGTTFNVSSTIGTFSGYVSNTLTIENMGTGTVNFYLNGTLSTTMTNGPTGMSANSGETFVVAFTNGAGTTSNRAFILSASALRMN